MIYIINESSPMLKFFLDMDKAKVKIHADKICKQVYDSLPENFKNEFSRNPVFLKMYYMTKRKGTIKVSMNYFGGTDKSIEEFNKRLVSKFNTDTFMTSKGTLLFYTEDNNILGKKVK